MQPLRGYVETRGVLLERDFLSPQLCARLIQFFQQHIATLGVDDAVPAFAHRVISLPLLDDARSDHAEIKRIMKAVRFLVGQRIAEWFGASIVLPEKTQLVVWPTGTQQGLHRDITRATTTYASIIYLNDDYVGGETYFTEHPPVTPRTGTMIAFHGIREEHGVSLIQSGTRYTMPMWFTDTPAAAES